MKKKNNVVPDFYHALAIDRFGEENGIEILLGQDAPIGVKIDF